MFIVVVRFWLVAIEKNRGSFLILCPSCKLKEPIPVETAALRYACRNLREHLSMAEVAPATDEFDSFCSAQNLRSQLQ